jgi:hypothetical protein
MDAYFDKCKDNMMLVVKEKDLCEWLKTFEPDKDKGFMFTNHPNIDIISQAVANDGHSGASFALCVRAVKKDLLETNWGPPLGTHILSTVDRP